MSDGTTHKESLDRFSSYLKERLENHKSPVDPESWDKIAGHFARRKKIRTIWIGAGIAAAILLAILWQPAPRETETIQEQLTEQEIPFRHKEDLPVSASAAPVIETLAIESPAVTPIPSSAIMGKKAEEEIEEEVKAEVVERDIPREKNEPQKKNEPFIPSKQEFFGSAELPKKKKSGKWLLAVVTGTGGGNASINFPSQENHPIFQNPSDKPNESPNLIPLPVPAEKGKYRYQHREYADIIHAIPLSAGITVRKEISRSVAIESGLLYTYLYSELKKNRFGENDKLQLHYLGVPLNLVGYMVNKPQWNIYVSGGVMFEKGITSVLTVRERVANEVISTTGKYSIPGIQISLNGAVGVAYRLSTHWSLYTEPKLYYYFDADQPPSVRAKHPFGFGANGGIRYHF